jgi:predicted CXXCH cytochrome family protein
MRNFLWFSLLLTGLVLFGCDSSEEPVTQQEPAKEEVVTTKEAQPVASTVATVQPTADQVKKKEELATDPSKKTDATEEAETTAEDTVKAAKAESPTVEEVTKAATEKITEVKEKAPPKSIVLEASYGNITFPHGMHADSYACVTCHNEGTPAAFELTKDVAHKVCKGCHKDEGSGPTGCKGCHVK